MKTIKTKLEIEVDLYVDYFDSVNIKVTASCEEGVKDFYIEHGLNNKDMEYVEDQPDVLSYLIAEINLDISHILKWADMVTVGFIAKEFAEYCVMKTDDKFYYCNQLTTLGEFMVTIMIYKLNENSRCYYDGSQIKGIESIKNFLEENKNGI